MIIHNQRDVDVSLSWTGRYCVRRLGTQTNAYIESNRPLLAHPIKGPPNEAQYDCVGLWGGGGSDFVRTKFLSAKIP